MHRVYRSINRCKSVTSEQQYSVGVNGAVKRVHLLNCISSSVDNVSAGKGSCAVWSVLDPRGNDLMSQD